MKRPHGNAQVRQGETVPSPVHILQGTASKVSHNLVGVLREVSEVLHGSHDSQTGASTPPPWGGANEPKPEQLKSPGADSVDSCKEANSESGTAPSSPEKNVPKEQPIITLETKDILTVTLPADYDSGAVSEDKPIISLTSEPQSEEHLATNLGSQTTKNLESHHSHRSEGTRSVGRESTPSISETQTLTPLEKISAIDLNNTDEEIVFSAKPRKHKKKRKKPGK